MNWVASTDAPATLGTAKRASRNGSLHRATERFMFGTHFFATVNYVHNNRCIMVTSGLEEWAWSSCGRIPGTDGARKRNGWKESHSRLRKKWMKLGCSVWSPAFRRQAHANTMIIEFSRVERADLSPAEAGLHAARRFSGAGSKESAQGAGRTHTHMIMKTQRLERAHVSR